MLLPRLRLQRARRRVRPCKTHFRQRPARHDWGKNEIDAPVLSPHVRPRTVILQVPQDETKQGIRSGPMRRRAPPRPRPPRRPPRDKRRRPTPTGSAAPSAPPPPAPPSPFLVVVSSSFPPPLRRMCGCPHPVRRRRRLRASEDAQIGRDAPRQRARAAAGLGASRSSRVSMRCLPVVEMEEVGTYESRSGTTASRRAYPTLARPRTRRKHYAKSCPRGRARRAGCRGVPRPTWCSRCARWRRSRARRRTWTSARSASGTAEHGSGSWTTLRTWIWLLTARA